MLRIIALILFTLATVGVCYFHEWLTWKRYDKKVDETSASSVKAKPVETKSSETKKSAKIAKLDFDINPDFDGEGVPYCDDGEVPYIDILHGYNRWNESYAEQKNRAEISKWLQPALARLEGQCDSMDFAVSDIQRMLDLLAEKGLTTIAGSTTEMVQSVLNTFNKNRAESVELLKQIDWTEDKKLLKKLKSTLYCLMDDDDELINGLDTFRAGIQNTLSKICEDEHPDHITDFTGLHELLKVPSALDHAFSEVEAAQEAEEAAKNAVPTMEIPARIKRPMDYFPELSLGTHLNTESAEDARFINSERSTNPMSDGF